MSTDDYKHNTLGNASAVEAGSSSVAPQDSSQCDSSIAADTVGRKARKPRKRRGDAEIVPVPTVAKPKVEKPEVHELTRQQSTIDDVGGGGSSAGFVLEPFVLSFGRWAGGFKCEPLAIFTRVGLL